MSYERLDVEARGADPDVVPGFDLVAQPPPSLVALAMALDVGAVIALCAWGFNAFRLFRTAVIVERALNDAHEGVLWLNTHPLEAEKARAFAAEEWGPAAEQRDNDFLLFSFNSCVPPLLSQWKKLLRSWIVCSCVWLVVSLISTLRANLADNIGTSLAWSAAASQVEVVVMMALVIAAQSAFNYMRFREASSRNVPIILTPNYIYTVGRCVDLVQYSKHMKRNQVTSVAAVEEPGKTPYVVITWFCVAGQPVGHSHLTFRIPVCSGNVTEVAEQLKTMWQLDAASMIV